MGNTFDEILGTSGNGRTLEIASLKYPKSVCLQLISDFVMVLDLCKRQLKLILCNLCFETHSPALRSNPFALPWEVGVLAWRLKPMNANVCC